MFECSQWADIYISESIHIILRSIGCSFTARVYHNISQPNKRNYMQIWRQILFMPGNKTMSGNLNTTSLETCLSEAGLEFLV